MKKFVFLFLFLVATISSHSQIKYKLDSISNNGGQQHKYLYNDQQLNTEDITFEWDSSILNFTPTSKSTFEYDSLANCVEYKNYSYDKNPQEWNESHRIKMSYDSQNNVLYSWMYSWKNSNWQLANRIDHENIYDDDDNLTKIIFHDYSDSGYKSYNSSFKYNSKNELIEVYHKYSTGGSRGYYFKNDTHNKFVEVIMRYQNSKVRKTELYYDENIGSKDVIKSMTYSSHVFRYSLNIYNKIFNVNNKIDKEIVYKPSGDSWEFDNELVYHYKEEISTSTPEIEKAEITVYPNPAKDFITFDIQNNATLAIFNLNGSIVLQQDIYEREQVNISELKSGVYLYKIISNDEQVSGKFIKQ